MNEMGEPNRVVLLADPEFHWQAMAVPTGREGKRLSWLDLAIREFLWTLIGPEGLQDIPVQVIEGLPEEVTA